MDNPNRPNINGNNDSGNQYRKRTGPAVNTSPGRNRNAQRTSTGTPKQAERRRQIPTPPGQMTPEMIKQKKRKDARRKMIRNNFISVSLILVVAISISALIASTVISCVNDILVINIPQKSDTSATVVIQDGMDTDQVIDALGDAGVIKNPWFCKLAAKFIGYSDEGYIGRTYDFHRSMGLESMLNEIKNISSKAAKTVTLTFPEGYTADQIIDMLDEQNVCSRDKLKNTMATVDFSDDFDFLLTRSDVDSRYIPLEGYLFPDTYQFYIGENAESVIKKFLNNFKNKWTENYSSLAQERRISIDQVVRLASIVEKEAVGADMPVVGSILFNRIDAGMRLECDSTSGYMAANKSGLSESEIAAYNQLYDTYLCSSLPVGAICNPGVDAIEAVLNAPDTGYYYFIHDANNEFHVAKTLSEQNNNIATYGLAG